MLSCCIRIRRLLIGPDDGVESYGSARGGAGVNSTVISHNPGDGESTMAFRAVASCEMALVQGSGLVHMIGDHKRAVRQPSRKQNGYFKQLRRRWC